MRTITVEVREDHLESLARTKPMAALAELLWNALDAEATEVRVEFVENELGGIERIRIVDNGHGLHYEDALIVFRNLGGSWKREGFRTHERLRSLHGRYGKGRFRAFSMGNHVAWRTVYADGEDVFAYSIEGDAQRLGEFRVSNRKGAPGAKTGMVVEISDVPENVEQLRGVKAQEEITGMFALYLRSYPDVRMFHDGVPLDPASVEQDYVEYDLGEMVMESGEQVAATLAVVEWDLPAKRGVYLCDAEGFVRHNALPRLHFRGFSYSAYLKSDHIAELDREGLLQAGELSTDVRQMLAAARAKLREHFALREAQRAQDILEEWREQGLYPYEGEPLTEDELHERHIFNIYATHLHQIFPDFNSATPRNKRLLLMMMRDLVHFEPTRVARILNDVLDFPEEKEEQIRELVEG